MNLTQSLLHTTEAYIQKLHKKYRECGRFPHVGSLDDAKMMLYFIPIMVGFLLSSFRSVSLFVIA